MEIVEGSSHVAREAALEVNRDAWRGGQGRHATLKGARGPRMSRRNSKRAQGSGWTGWTWAVAGSSLLHVALLGWLWRGGARQPAPVEPEAVAVELKSAEAVWHEDAPGAEALPDPPLPTLDQAFVARPLDD